MRRLPRRGGRRRTPEPAGAPVRRIAHTCELPSSPSWSRVRVFTISGAKQACRWLSRGAPGAALERVRSRLVGLGGTQSLPAAVRFGCCWCWLQARLHNYWVARRTGQPHVGRPAWLTTQRVAALLAQQVYQLGSASTEIREEVL